MEDFRVESKKQRRTRALVVMGAGASVEFGAPSTAELTKRVQERFVSDEALRQFGTDQAYQRINGTLASYLRGGQAAVTFEHVYHCAQEILSTTFEPTPGAVDEYRPILYPFIGRWAALNEEDALQALVRYLPEILYSEVSAASDEPEIPLRPLSRFVDRLRQDHVTRIYTTNYDDFVLQAAPDLYVGFGAGGGGEEPQRFSGENFWNAVDRDCVFHLHGSVHFGFLNPMERTDDLSPLCWYGDRAEALRHSRYNSSPERQMDGSEFIPSALITGFDKLARMQQTPQSHYYASLAHDAMKADIVYVVGFSLADLHVSARLAEARRRRPPPPLLFVDHWDGSFLDDTRWKLGRKEIEMLHRLRLLIVGDHYIRNATEPSPGWTLARDGSCAVWDRGFLEFLTAVDEHEEIVSRLTRGG